MKLSDFILLSLEQKGHAVLHAGTLVGKRTFKKQFIFLFQMDYYYAELFFNLKNRRLEEVRVFDKTKLLSPYLEAIPIDHLLQ